MKEALARVLWVCSVAAALASLCVAQAVGHKRQAPDLCQSRDRCLRLYQLGKAPSVAALEKAFHAGCDGYSEEAIRSLRLYQLGAPGGAHVLLNSMPRGIGDFMSLLWMTGDGTPETAGDIEYYYGAVYPKDELVTNGCRDGGPASNEKLFQSYFAALAKLSAAHPKYLPRFLVVSQLFGYKADWKDLNRCCGPHSSISVGATFSPLLASLLRARPAEFTRAAHASKFGYPAFRQGKAALAAEKRRARPAKPDKGSHGAR